MLQPPCVPAVRMFFVPHRLTREEWETRATIGGVLFERCRIAYHAPELPSTVRTRGMRWSKAVLASRVRTMRNRFHALCPYFAMFPEGFAEKWIDELTDPGDLVVDPFCGRGTTPFQALLMGRNALAGDINPVAYCLTAAKTQGPALSTVRRRISELESAYEARRWRPRVRSLPEFFNRAYNPRTLSQLLYLRDVLQWSTRRSDAMIAALVLGALHGESEKSPSYLSAQMPRTISTKPAYSVRFWDKHGYVPPGRDVFELLERQAKFRYASPLPELRGHVELTDFRDLHRLKSVRQREARLHHHLASVPGCNEFRGRSVVTSVVLGRAASPDPKSRLPR